MQAIRRVAVRSREQEIVELTKPALTLVSSNFFRLAALLVLYQFCFDVTALRISLLLTSRAKRLPLAPVPGVIASSVFDNGVRNLRQN